MTTKLCTKVKPRIAKRKKKRRNNIITQNDKHRHPAKEKEGTKRSRPASCLLFGKSNMPSRSEMRINLELLQIQKIT